MFESLSQRLSTTVNRLRGRGRLTEENIRESLREVRIALLEADVALPVVQALIERVKVRAVGQEVLKSLSPGQALVKVVSDELTAVMGTAEHRTESRPAAARSGVDGWPAGRRQDHYGRQARAFSHRTQKEACDGGELRRLSSRRYRTIAHAGRTGRREVLPVRSGPEPGRYRQGRDRSRAQGSDRRAAGRYRRPLARRRSDDGRDQGAARRAHADRNPVRGRLDDRPGRRQHGQGVQRGVAAYWRRA